MDTVEKEQNITLILTSNADEVGDLIKKSIDDGSNTKTINDSSPKEALKDSINDQNKNDEKTLDGSNNYSSTMKPSTDGELKDDNNIKGKKSDKSFDGNINVKEDGKLYNYKHITLM